MKLNHKGMTLIEILVVLVITSILLLVSGSIILNSFGYFDKTEVANRDKLAVDKMSDLIRDELVYASDVKISINPPTAGVWYALAVNDKGHLLKMTYEGSTITETDLYSNDYYNHRTLNLNARCYKNDYRMDLGFAFRDEKGDNVYETSLTLELINQRTNIISDSGDTSANSNSETVNISSNTKYKIYYQKGTLSFKNDPKNDISGTVLDEGNCKNESNNRGEWKSKTTYYKGEFVLRNNIWYVCVKDAINNTTSPESSTTSWKQIDATYQVTSIYMKGDIVIYQDEYYQAIKDDTVTAPNITADWSGPHDTVAKATEETGITPSYFSCSVNTDTLKGMVVNKDDDIPLEDIENFDDAKSFGKEKFVRDENNDVWLKMTNGGGKNDVPGVRANNGQYKGQYTWQKIQVYWDKTSRYTKADVIRFADNGRYYMYIGDDDSGKGGSPASRKDSIWETDPNWKMVQYRNGKWQ